MYIYSLVIWSHILFSVYLFCIKSSKVGRAFGFIYILFTWKAEFIKQQLLISNDKTATCAFDGQPFGKGGKHYILDW